MLAANNTLSALRDIHLPPAIAWWPPAPGWAALFLLLAFAAGFLLYRAGKWWFKSRRKQRILQRLAHLEKNPEGLPHQDILAQLSGLLRQSTLVKFNRHQVAGLQGVAWLQFLQDSSGLEAFAAQGRLLIHGPYNPHTTPEELHTLFGLTRQWIKRCL